MLGGFWPQNSKSTWFTLRVLLVFGFFLRKKIYFYFFIFKNHLIKAAHSARLSLFFSLCFNLYFFFLEPLLHTHTQHTEHSSCLQEECFFFFIEHSSCLQEECFFLFRLSVCTWKTTPKKVFSTTNSIFWKFCFL